MDDHMGDRVDLETIVFLTAALAAVVLAAWILWLGMLIGFVAVATLGIREIIRWRRQVGTSNTGVRNQWTRWDG